MSKTERSKAIDLYYDTCDIFDCDVELIADSIIEFCNTDKEKDYLIKCLENLDIIDILDEYNSLLDIQMKRLESFKKVWISKKQIQTTIFDFI